MIGVVQPNTDNLVWTSNWSPKSAAFDCLRFTPVVQALIYNSAKLGDSPPTEERFVKVVDIPREIKEMAAIGDYSGAFLSVWTAARELHIALHCSSATDR